MYLIIALEMEYLSVMQFFLPSLKLALQQKYTWCYIRKETLILDESTSSFCFTVCDKDKIQMSMTLKRCICHDQLVKNGLITYHQFLAESQPQNFTLKVLKNAHKPPSHFCLLEK